MATIRQIFEKHRSRARDGHMGQHDRRLRKRMRRGPTPLAFALAIMRDESKPDALRASMAKAVLPYLHKLGYEKEDDG